MYIFIMVYNMQITGLVIYDLVLKTTQIFARMKILYIFAESY